MIIVYMPRSTNKPVTYSPAVQNKLAVNERPSLFSSMKHGFGFGIGSSIAHNIFDSKATNPLPTNPLPPLHHVIDKTREFKQCMEKTNSNYEECAPILK